jgi:hypothetical protein
MNILNRKGTLRYQFINSCYEHFVYIFTAVHTFVSFLLFLLCLVYFFFLPCLLSYFTSNPFKYTLCRSLPRSVLFLSRILHKRSIWDKLKVRNKITGTENSNYPRILYFIKLLYSFLVFELYISRLLANNCTLVQTLYYWDISSNPKLLEPDQCPSSATKKFYCNMNIHVWPIS